MFLNLKFARKAFLVFLLTVTFSNTSLFSQVIWDKNYESGYCQKIVETEDGGYFAISNQTFVKVNSNGDTIFTNKTTGFNSYSRNYVSCAYLHDGFIAVTCNLWKDGIGAVCILNRKGGIVNEKKFVKGVNITDMINSGRMIYLSLSGSTHGLLSISSSLDSMWMWKNNSNDAFVKLSLNNAKSIVGITGEGRLVVVKNDGKLEFVKKTLNSFNLGYYNTNSYLSLYQKNNFYYLLHSNLQHTKISLTGDSISSTKLFEAGQWDRGTSIADDHGFTFLNFSGDSKWKLIKTDENYQILDNISFDVKEGYKTTCIILKDSFSKYVLGGNQEWGGRLRLLKYGFGGLANTLTPSKTSVSCYYNEDLEKIIVSSNEVGSHFDAEIYDTKGRKIISKNFANGDEISVSTSGIPS